MQSMNRRFISLFLVLLGIAYSCLAQAAYEFTSIDPLGAKFTEVYGIDNSGQVVVSADNGNYLYNSRNRSFTALAPYDDPSGLSGISESGVIVGSSFNAPNGPESGLIRSMNGIYTSFFHPYWPNTNARAVGNTGLVTGFSYKLDNFGSRVESVGFIYDPASGSFVDFLPQVVFNRPTIAQGINGRGQVVGSFRVPVGSVAPQCGSGSGCTYAFLREPDGVITFFRVNGESTRARGITDSGRIVGFIDGTDGLVHGFVGSLAGLPASGENIPDVELLDVPASLATLDYEVISTIAQAINNAGVIVGAWTEFLKNSDPEDPDNYKTHGFIATPVRPKTK
jgi:hypothetical protein